MKLCVHSACTRVAVFNIEGSQNGVYCSEHADMTMVNVHNRRCLHSSCKKQPNFNFNLEGNKTGAYCLQHAKDGMVNVRSRRCFHDSCLRTPRFNMEGRRRPIYCRPHAEDGMMDVVTRRCLNELCTKIPSFNSEGRRTPLYCKQHALDGMTDVDNRRCSQTSCQKQSAWGLMTGGAGTACGLHKSKIVGGLVINFRARCKVVGCRKISKWGVPDKQPTHCPVHGPNENELVCIDGATRIGSGLSGSPFHAEKERSSDVKAECSF